MEMCFHGNQLSWGIKHPLISLRSKYRSPAFIRLSTMLAPVISSLDEIYCMQIFLHTNRINQSNKLFLFVGKVFKVRKLLTLHVSKFHTKTLCCKICDKKFFTKPLLYKHMQGMVPSRSYCRNIDQ